MVYIEFNMYKKADFGKTTLKLAHLSLYTFI